MVWRKVGVNHCVIDLLMTENFLQHKNVAAIRHEVTRERMTQNVSRLSFWQVGQSFRQPFVSHTVTAREKPIIRWLIDLVIQLFRNRHRSV